MFCQWCGKQWDPTSNAIHSCGPKSRPPAFCMACGAPLADGATSCAACGTAAGKLPTTPPSPAPVPASAAVPADPAVDVAASPAQADAPTPLEAPSAPPKPLPGGKAPPVTLATALVMRPRERDQVGASLRGVMLTSAIVGIVGFFVDWGIALAQPVPVGRIGISTTAYGIVLAEHAKLKVWPTSPQIILALMCIALVLCVSLNVGAERAAIGGVVIVVGLVLTAVCADWIWLLRHHIDVIIGFWLVVGASVAVLVSSIAYVTHERRAG